MIRIGINGFGRIGRTLARVVNNRPDMEIVAINDLADAATLAHLLKYDSVHRAFPGTVETSGDQLVINGVQVSMSAVKDPKDIPWKSAGVDVVIESTGHFRTLEAASGHLTAGASRVIISAPPQSADVKTVVLGVNDHILDANEPVISNASCTTNCAAPMVKVLDEKWGIESGYITTVHSYTTDQRLHDAPHADLRRARAAAYSIVPTTTGAAKAITRIFTHLEGKMGGCGIRVPVPDGSLTDLTCILSRAPESIEEVNDAFLSASEGTLAGILAFNPDPIVSIDIVGNPYSCIFDPGLTSVMGSMVKVVGWYDNEMGYSNRLADLIARVAV